MTSARTRQVAVQVLSSLLIVVAMLLAPSPAIGQANYALRVDTASGHPGTQVDLAVKLTNSAPVGSFNLLLSYDPTALYLNRVSNVGTRSSGFEYFNYTLNVGGVPGHVRIVGMANVDGPPVPVPIPAGDGSIVGLRFAISNDIDYAGMWVPIWFEFSDPLTQDDNTLTDGVGNKITQQQIDYYDGWVIIEEMGEVELGDVNLNGIPYEISDYVYLTNYIIFPNHYPMNALQLANSDVNHDGVPATIADLITIINMIMGGKNQAGGIPDPDLPATVYLDEESDQTTIGYATGYDVGAVLLTLAVDPGFEMNQIVNRHRQMQMALAREGDLIRAFVYSTDGSTLPAGDNPLLTIVGGEVEVRAVELASADARTASVILGRAARLPQDFVLKQNYPNPFNPTTTIEFELASTMWVELTVYDMLGQTVARLADQEFSAGRHAVVFDGRDQDGHILASGVYFYRLDTERGTLTRKMMLMK